MVAVAKPLTLGTAGHVDHGKTALVAALTGVDTDRLPEEKARGLTIELGYAKLPLPSGRAVSLIDVPGHARFVRTMVSGATGIDLFLMVVAADDGVMPQTIEHANILRALDVRPGVVAVTKVDVTSPEAAAAEAAELMPGVEIIPCSARSGEGLTELVQSLDRVVARLSTRPESDGPVRLHVDRAFTIVGRGTVVTGTLWSGSINQGETLELLPAGASVRVRGLEVHGEPTGTASAGQRVAVNLIGNRAREAQRGDVLVAPKRLRETSILDCVVEAAGLRHGQRVQVLHGTRAVTARVVQLEDDLWQLRLERSLVAGAGDHFVIRQVAPPDTLGGGVVVDPYARRHGRRPDIIERLTKIRAADCSIGQDPPEVGESEPVQAHAPGNSLAEPSVQALEQRLLSAGTSLLSEAQIVELDEMEALRILREANRALRVSGRLYGHADVVAEVRARIIGLIQSNGAVSLAGVRDSLDLSRKTAQAFLEHLDGTRVTRRLPDDTRILILKSGPSAGGTTPAGGRDR